jgi:endonuclease/exonuclease/phosphatase family metal-dependent hydrolase
LAVFVYPKTIPRNAAVGRADRAFSVVSLNTAKEANPSTIMQALDGAPRLRDADVYLFQEVRQESGKPSVPAEALEGRGYHTAFRPAPGFIDQGLAIVSRYPLTNITIIPLKAYDLRFHSRNRFALGATMETPWGEIRIWNLHLDTRINAEERLAQLQPVIDTAAKYPGPKLIGGDFNTNTFHWIENVLPIPDHSQGSVVRTSLESIGFKSPFADSVTTHPLLHSHLDWIFLSNLKALDSSVEPASFSDHNAIWVQAQI